jgi:hypothetical protein
VFTIASRGISRFREHIRFNSDTPHTCTCGGRDDAHLFDIVNIISCKTIAIVEIANRVLHDEIQVVQNHLGGHDGVGRVHVHECHLERVRGTCTDLKLGGELLQRADGGLGDMDLQILYDARIGKDVLQRYTTKTLPTIVRRRRDRERRVLPDTCLEEKGGGPWAPLSCIQKSHKPPWVGRNG